MSLLFPDDESQATINDSGQLVDSTVDGEDFSDSDDNNSSEADRRRPQQVIVAMDDDEDDKEERTLSGGSKKRGPKKKALTKARLAKLKQRRVKANARERHRMHGLNGALDDLRRHVPCTSRTQKLSKIETLRMARNYIETLADILASNVRPDGITFARSLTKGLSQGTVNLIAGYLRVHPRTLLTDDGRPEAGRTESQVGCCRQPIAGYQLLNVFAAMTSPEASSFDEFPVDDAETVATADEFNDVGCHDPSISVGPYLTCDKINQYLLCDAAYDVTSAYCDVREMLDTTVFCSALTMPTVTCETNSRKTATSVCSDQVSAFEPSVTFCERESVIRSCGDVVSGSYDVISMCQPQRLSTGTAMVERSCTVNPDLSTMRVHHENSLVTTPTKTHRLPPFYEQCTSTPISYFRSTASFPSGSTVYNSYSFDKSSLNDSGIDCYVDSAAFLTKRSLGRGFE